MKIKSGGGITSNKLVTSKGYKQEPIANKASPAGAGQLGAAVQFRKEPLIQGRGYNPPGVPRLAFPVDLIRLSKDPAVAAQFIHRMVKATTDQIRLMP